MKIQIKESDHEIFAALSGELDHHSAPKVREKLDAAIERQPGANLLLDMAEVTFMDSTGIGMVMGRYKKIRPAGGEIRLYRPPKQIERLFAMSGLEQIIKR